jgi:Domain of unknown function (DUF4386)
MPLHTTRPTGMALILTGVTAALGATLGDPAIESHDDRERFIEQVADAADRIPAAYTFQIMDVGRGLLALAAAVGLYLLLRERPRGETLLGLALLAVSGVLAAITAIVGAAMVRAADDYTGGGLAGIGTGSNDTLELIRVLAVVHFGSFLTGFAALGIGGAAFAYGLARNRMISQWLGRLGLFAGALLLLTPLALAADVLFLPFFVGTILTLVWLLAAGLSLALRSPDTVFRRSEAAL